VKKNAQIALVVIVAVLLIYGVAWIQQNSMSNKYYKDAMGNFEKGDYVIALKGKKVEKEDGSGYEFMGGFQQVNDIWSSPYAFPKPSAYKKSKEMANEIIKSKIDIKTGMDMLKQYLQIDKGYLGEIMLNIADQYLRADDKENAIETYKTIVEAFPNDADILNIAKKKLKEFQ
jgi:tetratricopeptide (TPR) repeat protein